MNRPGEIHILHVDDEPDFAELTADMLERGDDRFTVETATSPSDGMDRLASDEFDCIVSDYDMPGMNGIEFLEHIREEYPTLPFLLFTGKGSEEVASNALTKGATDYLQKGSGTDQYELLANRIRNATDQYHATRRATELDRVRTLVSDINQVLLRAESRDEMETRVCEIISDATPYLFAWIGHLDTDTGRIEPETSAGIDASYLDDITVTTDETPTGQGPGGTAARERRIAVAQNIADDPEFEPWRDAALERGFQAVAAVPLEYDDTLYGVLSVYADRPDAFDANEQELLAELGADIAHAIHGFEIHGQLREERDRRQALFENAPGPVIVGEVHDADGHHQIIEVNDAFAETFGYEAEEVIGRDVTEVLIPDEHLAAYGEFRERALAGESITAEVERLTADGPRDFLMHIIPFRTDEDDGHGTYAWYTDITEQIQREQSIEALHSTARALMEADTAEEIAEIVVDAAHEILDMPANGVHLYDDGRGGLVPVAWTEQTEEIVGEPPTFAPGEGIAGVAYETGEAEIYDDISTVSARYNPDTDVRSQIALPLAEHGVLVIGSEAIGSFDDTAVDLARTLATHATTALTRLSQETDLRTKTARLEALFENSPDMINIHDTEGNIIDPNPALCEATGYDEDQLTEMKVWELDQAIEPDEARSMWNGMAPGDRERLEGIFQRSDGSEFPVEVHIRRLNVEEMDRFMVISRDITERKSRERTLRELQYRTEELIRASSKEEIAEIAVATAEDVLGLSLSGVHLTDEERNVLEPTAVTDEVHEHLGEAPAYDQENPERSVDEVNWEVFEAGETVVIEDTNDFDLTAESETPSRSGIILPLGDHGLFVTSSPEPHAFDESDVALLEIFATIVTAVLDRNEREATLRKRTRRLESQNERLDEFVGIVSHDLRNPLKVAQGRLELAREERDNEHLEVIDRSHERMNDLIEDLLELARAGEMVSEMEMINLDEFVEECWQDLETADANIRINTQQTIRADGNRLRQILQNLFRNSVEHGDAGVTVTVGDYNRGFYIEDDGTGIPEDKREVVFETGYTTSEQGTGFGLNIVKQIVDSHGWEIRVTDSPEGGARFEITGVEIEAH